MKAEMVSCDNTRCSNKAPVPSARTHPDDWWIIFGPHPHGRLDFCSIACMSTWCLQPIETTDSNLRSITT